MRGRIVLATYNEAHSIPAVLAEIEEAVTILRRSGIELDVLLVDDSSPDFTADIALKEAARLGLQLEVLSGERVGLGRAMMRGLDHVGAADAPEFYVTLDADGQHDARQIPDLVRAFLARGSGMTIGSRWTRGGSSPGTPPTRALLSRAGNLLVRCIGGVHGVKDATTSFRVIRHDVARTVRSDDVLVDGYAFFSAYVAVVQAHGFPIDEVPICFRPRYSGMSKLGGHDLVEFFLNQFRVRARVRQLRSRRA